MDWRRTGPRLGQRLGGLFAAVVAGWAHAGAADPAAQLRQAYADAAPRLRNSAFDQPLSIESTEASGRLSGDVYALVDYPFATVRATFAEPRRWCEVLELTPNVRACAVRASASGRDSLDVRLGRSFDQPVEDAYPVRLSFRVPHSGEDYFAARLDARRGPVGTSDYDIRLEAVPQHGRTFLHFSYAYSYGPVAYFAAEAYLRTKGSHKVGFTVVDRDDTGTAHYVGGLRGAVERNAMRYYLAIDAHLAASARAPDRRFDASLERWLQAIARHARQLAEPRPQAYAAAKRAQRSGEVSPR